MEFQSVKLFSVLPDAVVPLVDNKVKVDRDVTKVFFLGGLMHLNSLDLSKGLAESLWELMPKHSARKAEIFTLAVGDADNILPLIAVGDAVTEEQNKNGRIIPSHIAERILDQVIAPDSVCNKWSQLPKAEQKEIMDDYFDHIRLIGYSHGTSLIQQVEKALRHKLSAYQLPLDPLQKVGAINIAPVAAPEETMKGRDHALFHKTMREVANQVKSEGRFKQLLVARRADKVMSIRVGHDLLDMSCQDYAVLKAGNIVSISEYCGDDMLRFMKISTFASGNKSPKIIYQFDHEGHALRLFSNILEAKQDDVSCTYPSSNLGYVLREGMREMLKPSGAEWSFDCLQTIQDFTDPVLGDFAKKEARQQLEQNIQSFDAFIEKYRGCVFTDSIKLIEDNVKQLREKTSHDPKRPEFVKKDIQHTEPSR